MATEVCDALIAAYIEIQISATNSSGGEEEQNYLVIPVC
jgi:hypothetical protein